MRFYHFCAVVLCVFCILVCIFCNAVLSILCCGSMCLMRSCIFCNAAVTSMLQFYVPSALFYVSSVMRLYHFCAASLSLAVLCPFCAATLLSFQRRGCVYLWWWGCVTSTLWFYVSSMLRYAISMLAVLCLVCALVCICCDGALSFYTAPPYFFYAAALCLFYTGALSPRFYVFYTLRFYIDDYRVRRFGWYYCAT
jgi:hypothetical protein